MNHHWSCACVGVLPLFLQRSSTSACFLPPFPPSQYSVGGGGDPFIPASTSRGLVSHSLPDVHVSGCSWRRHARTRGAEQEQVLLRPLPTASTRCGFSKHMTSTITGTGPLNRLKICTYVARQQRNRFQSPPPPPPHPFIQLSAGIAAPLSLKMVN